MPMRFPLLVVAVALILVPALMAGPTAASPSLLIPAEDAARAVAGSAVAPDLTLGAGAAEAEKAFPETGYYIVVLEQDPLATYRGGIEDLKATSPIVTGEANVDVESDAGQAYLAFLDAVQSSFITSMERALGQDADVLFRYRHALNGLAVWLTPEQAALVAAMPGVVSVTPNTPQPLDTDAGPAWIGAPGIWTGESTGDEGSRGEGIVVGVVDTGINFDHPSFAEVDKNGYEHLNPKDGYLGVCDPEHEDYDERFQCNEKLIGAYSFLDGTPNAGNPEDDNGHGSHTASTAAGNFVTAAYGAPTITLDLEVSGVAPHANIVAYDACFTTSSGQGTCPPTATLAALDQAVADGVDVVNYSISTSNNSPWEDPHARAFFALREAGIFAAVSAGNSGPRPETTAAIAPWVTAVAATTHDRYFGSRLAGFAGGGGTPPEEIEGKSLSAGVGPAPIVYAGAGYKNVSGQEDDGTCSVAFPAGTFDGEIVVCDRVGNVARVQRGANVRAGGAGGFVLANSQAQGDSTVDDGHILPAIHISYEDGVTLKDWLASGNGHTAVIAASTPVLSPAVADQMAGFSSRGPAVSSFCCRRPDLPQAVAQYYSLLKPDVAAPGQNIIAAVASGNGSNAPEFAAYGGTSMSAPHVAGAAALLHSVHPDWTMAEIQSALMTTAVVESMVKEDGRTPADPFDYGAGRVNVREAVRAGLVLNATSSDFSAADPALGGDPTDINTASLLDPACLDKCSWTRRVRSTLDQAVTWTVATEVAEAFTDLGISVSPESFTLQPGAEQEISIEADVSLLPRDQWAFGTLYLRPDAAQAPEAHMNLAARTVPSLAPAMVPVFTLDATGTKVIEDVRAMEIIDFQADVYGLAEAAHAEFELMQDPNPADRFTLNDGKGVVTMTVPANARRIVAEVYESESDDIDLFLGIDLNSDGRPQANELACQSLGESWIEYCDIVATNIPSSTWWVLLQNYAASDDAPDLTKVAFAAVPDADAGNLTVTAPSEVPMGEPFDIELDWDLPSMQEGDRWFGLVSLSSDPVVSGDLGLLRVDVIGREAPAPTATPPVPTPSPTVEPTLPYSLFLPRALRVAE